MSADTVTIHPPRRPFSATVHVPGDKSLSHRALIFAALAQGRSPVSGIGTGADVASTGRVLAALGVGFDRGAVVSPGVEGWQLAPGELECGNSGTTLRLMAGALAGRPFPSVLNGDESLRRRPMRRLVAPLQALGAAVSLGEHDTAPVAVVAERPLHAADVALPIASAQVRSAFELAALQAEGISRVESPPGFRDHTERWLATMGLGERETPTRFAIRPGSVPTWNYQVPGDPSSAAFLWATASILEGSEVHTPGISLNAGRIGFLQVLEAMGAEVEAQVTGALLGDPVGTVTVRGRGLHAAEISGALAVATLDELPLVAVLAAYGEGVTLVKDAAELRTKESDRVAATVALIRALGGGAEETEDGFAVVGTGWLESGTVESHGDHRIAMAGAIAATKANGPVSVHGAGVAAVSWPDFYPALEAVWSSR
jgi:3-phosphoshikimate 1-carboxyvinyltransferase